MRTFIALLALVAYVAPAAAQPIADNAATIKAGALKLTWSQTGRVSGVQCGGADLTGAGVPASGMAIRDCATQEVYEPLSGQVRATAEGLRVSGRNGAGTLAVAADCVAEKNWLVVRGEVENLTEADRAVSLRFALPVTCQDWRWGTRLHSSEALLPGRCIHLGDRTTLGSGHMALRPVAAIFDKAHTLGLVVPVDFIGLYDFSADADKGLFSLVIDFAMTKHCPRFFKKVAFEFYIDGEADGWGLRSVLARYYENRPQFFERHTPEAGGWFAWGDILRLPPPVCDYGLMFHEQPESREGYAHDQALGIRTYPYIEPIMYQMCLGDQPKDKIPERKLILDRLEEWARFDTTGRLPSGGWETQEALQRVCQAIIQSGVRDRDGNVVIGSVAQYNWISGTKWAAQFPLNLSPAIPRGAGQDRLDYVRTNLLNSPYLTGIYLDSFSAHASKANYATDQLKYLGYAPPFDASTFEPCTINGLAIHEWVEALWNVLPADKKELLPNLYNQPVPFPWHRFTVMGKEHWIEPSGPLMQQFRTMAHRKVVTQLPTYEDKDEQFLRNLMLLDVFPGGYARRSTDPPSGMCAAYRIVIPLLRQLHRLGWEPVTRALPASSGIRIERYGSTPGPIAFVIQNPFEADIVRFEVDARSLALPDDAFVVDAVDGEPVEYARQRGELQVAIGLKGNSTTVLVAGNRDAHAQWRRMLADDRLDDVRLCLKESALRQEVDAHPAWALAANLSRATTPEEMSSVSKAITGDAPTEVRARELLAIAATLTRQAFNPEIVPSRGAQSPAEDSRAALPWTEAFQELSPQRWAFSDGKQPEGIRVASDRLEMELPRDATGAEIHTVESWPFVPRPLAIETDFKFSHGDHDRYLRLSMKVAGTTDSGGEYILIRIESSGAGSATIWVENHNAPLTSWQHTLTERRRFDPTQPHHLRLRLERETFRLEMDGVPVGEGPHECEFGWANLALGVFSGHRGHGDVCWWDNLQVRTTP